MARAEEQAACHRAEDLYKARPPFLNYWYSKMLRTKMFLERISSAPLPWYVSVETPCGEGESCQECVRQLTVASL